MGFLGLLRRRLLCSGQITGITVAVVVFSGVSAAHAQETRRLQFVTEYVRELSHVEGLRQRAADNMAGDPAHGLTNCIADMTSLQLEYRSQVRMMKGMALRVPFDGLPAQIAAFYQFKIDLYGQFIDACSTMAAGPKPGVDYGEIAANLPKIRANLDYVDRSLFEASPLVFATLIDERADAAGHVNHLVITKAERAQLLGDMATAFGDKLNDAAHAGYVVQTAVILRDYLLKDYKASDEPW